MTFRRYIRLSILFAGMLSVVLTSPGQIYPFRHYTGADGLAQVTVEKLFQDTRGFLWLGTRDGVSRYDGNEFRSYLSDGPEKSDVKDVWEDDDGTLWFITYGNGIARLSPAESTFVWMKAGDGILPDDRVNTVMKDSRKRLWIGTMRGLVVLFPDGAHRRMDMSSRLHFSVVHAVIEDRSGIVWIGTENGLLRCALEGNGPLHTASVFDRPTRSLALLRNGDILAATTGGHDRRQGGVFRFHGDSMSTLISYETIGIGFTGLAIHEDRQGTIWIGSSEGLWTLRGKTITRLRKGNGLPNEYVYDICEDEEGTLWFGTENGAAKLPARQLVSYQALGEPANNIILALAEDRQGSLWLGTYHGLLRLTPDHAVKEYREVDGLSDRLINALVEDEQGRIWVGTKRGLNIVSSGTVMRRAVGGLPAGRSVASIARGADHSMWLGCYDSIFHVTADGRSTVFDKRHGVPPGPVRAITCDRSGTVWFGTDSHGAGCLRDGRVTMLSVREGLRHNQVHSVYVDRRGTVWFATLGGVSYVQDGQLRQLEVDEPTLRQGPVHCIAEDSSGRYWFGSDRGIFGWSGRAVQHLTTQDGLAADIVERVIVDPGGRLWLGTHDGVSCLDRPAATLFVPVPSLYFRSVAVGDNERPLTGESEIDYGDRTVVFQFNALSFVDERAMEFQWKLDAFDRDWQHPQRQRQVRYTNLSPGKYGFVVRARNRNGEWSNPIRFAFFVHPPFWQTWWFVSLVVTALATLVLLVHRYRVRQLLAVERMRSRIAADLHDDIASSLASVALYADAIQRHTPLEGGEEIRPLLSRIGELSRDVMENIGTIVWAVDPRRDELMEVFRYFQRHGSQLSAAAGVSFVSCLPEYQMQIRLSPEQRREIFLILKEALNNALRHGQCHKVEFSFSANDGTLDLALKDDGCGFDNGSTENGHGLANMRARAVSIGAELGMESEPGIGTTVRLRLRIA